MSTPAPERPSEPSGYALEHTVAAAFALPLLAVGVLYVFVHYGSPSADAVRGEGPSGASAFEPSPEDGSILVQRQVSTQAEVDRLLGRAVPEDVDSRATGVVGALEASVDRLRWQASPAMVTASEALRSCNAASADAGLARAYDELDGGWIARPASGYRLPDIESHRALRPSSADACPAYWIEGPTAGDGVAPVAVDARGEPVQPASHRACIRFARPAGAGG